MYKMTAIFLLLSFTGIIKGNFIYIDPGDYSSTKREYLLQIAATAGSISVTYADIESVVDQFLKNSPADYQQLSKSELRKKALDEILYQRLLEKQFEKYDITAQEQEIDAMIEQILQEERLNLEQLKARIAQQGINYTFYRNTIAGLVKAKKIAQHLAGDELEVSDEELKQYYLQNQSQFYQPEQVRLSQIAVRVGADADEKYSAAAKIIIDVVRQKAINGEDFAWLAIENSDCTSAVNGGDLGYGSRKMVIPSLVDEIFEMPKDKISRVRETTFGYHIVMVTDKKEAAQLSLEQVRDVIKFQIELRKTEDFLQHFRHRLLTESNIIYYKEFE